MKKLLSLISLLLLSAYSYGEIPDSSVISIIPKPVQTKTGVGKTIITPEWKIYIPNSEWSGDEQIFNTYLKNNFDFSMEVVHSKPKGKNFILLKKNSDKPVFDDQYHLSVTNKNITITAFNQEGIFYGLQSLMQLLPLEKTDKISVPQVEVEDYSRFKWRGMHLDVSRHFFTKDEIKKYIDYLARYKMNVFHWHLTDDQGWRIEIKSHPDLTTIGAWRNGTMIGPYKDQKFDSIRYGGFYTQEDIREIVLYAQKHFVTIVPEIEMPGHVLAALAAYPNLSCTETPLAVGKAWGVYDDVFCPKEETFKFLEDVLTEVCELFPGKYIHIGGDEVPKTRWKNCAHCQQLIKTLGLKNETELQSYFTGRIEKFLNSKRKQIIGWEEILEGGLLSNAAVMSWRGVEGGIAAAKQKHFAVMTPGDYCYFDHYQSANSGEPLAFGGYTSTEKVYSYEPVPANLNVDEKKYILGAQGNLWSEYIPNFAQVECMIFPRMCALAEVLWSADNGKRNYYEFVNRLSNQFLFFEKNKINYSKAIFDIRIKVDSTADNNGLHISFDALKENNDAIHYTIDGSDPKADSALIKQDFKIYNSCLVKAGLFGTDEKMKGKIIEQKLNVNKATGKKIFLIVQPSEKYNIGGAFTLVNGVTGDLPWKGSDWIGFSGENMNAIIDFGKTESYSTLTLDVLSENSSWIYLPKTVEVFSSDDGVVFKSLRKISTEEIKAMNRQLKLEFNQTQSRFIKVAAENFGIIPDGFAGAENPAWMFVDEISVE